MIFPGKKKMSLLLLLILFSSFVYAESDLDAPAKVSCSEIVTSPPNKAHSINRGNEDGVSHDKNSKERARLENPLHLLAKEEGKSSLDELARCDVGVVAVMNRASAVMSVPFLEKNHCISHAPHNRATNVQINEPIVIKAEPLWEAYSGDFSLWKNNRLEIPIIACQMNGLVALKPVSPLSPFSSYTVVVKPLAVNKTEKPTLRYSWSFTTGEKPLPLLGLWEANMVTYGDKWGRYLETYYPKPFAYNEARGVYYDAQRVYFQIATYTGTSEPWDSYAEEAERVYRTYLDSRKWATQGWRKFARGFYMDWVKKGDPADKAALLALRDNKVFHNPEAFGRVWFWSHRSREVAYALEANVYAERAGHARNDMRVALYVDMALNHIDEWVTGRRENPDKTKHRFAPFMAGLTAEALISFYEWEVDQGHNPDDRIPAALAALAEFLWVSKVVDGPNAGKDMWVNDLGGRGPRWTDEGGTGYGAFRYEDQNNAGPAPSLNLLIAPLYAWLYRHYGDGVYIERGDLIWEGGVALSNVGWNTKIFNQNYRWSIDYVEWRRQGMKK